MRASSSAQETAVSAFTAYAQPAIFAGGEISGMVRGDPCHKVTELRRGEITTLLEKCLCIVEVMTGYSAAEAAIKLVTPLRRRSN